jgi:8-oxo-dGTP pyrophosphatase MutT (NUDIX family)
MSATLEASRAVWRAQLRRMGELTTESRYLRARPPADGAEVRPSAVLALVGLDLAGDPALLLIRRSDQLTHHAGQFGFPGGMQDPADPTPEATALRETTEEVGLAPAEIETLGRLPQFPTATTGWRIQPVLGLLGGDRDAQVLRPDPREVEEAFWVRLADLQAAGCFREETFERAGVRYVLPAYQLGERRIWGATALMIHHFLERLEISGKLGA